MKRFMVICLCVALISGWGYMESLRVGVVRVNIENSSLAHALDGKTVAFLSDIHMDSWGYREKRMMSLLEQLHPDMILLTGDFIPWRGDIHPALEFLSRLSAPLGVYAVFGDYDYSNSRNSCLFCHQKDSGRFTEVHDVHMLRNNAACLGKEGKGLCIFGLDYKNDPEIINKSYDYLHGKPLIILAHDPLAFSDLDETLGGVELSGDTHGGQIYLPSWLWHMIGYEKNARFNYGIFKKGTNTMFVTRGVGTSHVPFRLFCPPEIVALTFSSREAK